MCLGYIALGGNLGNVAETFNEALDRLDAHREIEVRARSSNYRTAAVGENAGDDFVNAAAEVSTTLEPLQLLDQIQSVENDLGRTRELHWGPRTIDLDIIQYDQLVIDSPKLVLPHPHCWYRRFVLDPLVEIAPELVHPCFELCYHELRQRVIARPLSICVLGISAQQYTTIKKELGSEFSNVEFVDQPLKETGLNIQCSAVAGKTSESPVVDISGADDLLQSVRDVLLSAL